MTRINTNVSSLTAQKSLARSNVSLQQALTRLSTGLRINVGKDDPAGLIASEMLRSDIISVERAIGNSERANQMIATADSALGQVSSLLNDIRGLVTEAANQGAMSDDQIAANQLQIDSSLEAINRIAQTTTFQGRRLLDGSLAFVTDSASVATIQDLQIDQANLGATGSIAVDVDIASAATQATIRSASGTSQATTTLYFAAGEEWGAGNFADANAVLTVNASALGPAEDGVTIKFNLVDSIAAGSEYATYDAAAKQLNVYVDDNAATTIENVANAIDALDEWTAVGTNVDSGVVNAADMDGLTGVTGRDSLALTAATAGPEFNDVSVQVTTQNALGANNPTAVYLSDSKTIRITIDDTAATALTDIGNAFNSVTEFTAVATASGTGNVEGGGGVDPGAIANTGITGYLNAGFSASTNAQATLSFAAGAEFVPSDFNAGAVEFDVNATALGTAESGVVISFVADSTAVGSEYAEYSASAKTLQIHISSTAATNAANVVAAIDALDEWDAKVITGGVIDGNAANTSDAAVTKTTGVDSLTITALTEGADFNNLQIQMATESGLGAANPTAVYDSTANTLTITVDDTDATELTAIDAAIDALSLFASSHNPSGSTRVEGAGADRNATANTDTSGGNVLLDDLVFELGGTSGTEVFNFQAGASVNQVAAAINLISDATGVTASQSAGLLTLTSSTYGSNALASVAVTNEGAAGTFDDALSATRVNGTDIQATVNGIAADGDGNTLSINTATLDLTMTVTAGSSTNFEFNITGGGALFQMGPEVVSNQQVRLGIESINSATLGGESGKLYLLGSGQSAALATDTTLAGRIVDEVVDKVTSLRGRLGAFQRTTLDTNIATLNDTLENLSAAESSIRDADFAAETAALTRAQILVQSGISVLAVANSNPQNVLALLR